jgi:outer membrane protein assembly factor BamB
LLAFDAKSGQLKMNWVPPSSIERIGSFVVGNDGTVYMWTSQENTSGWGGGIRDNKFSLYAISPRGQIVWRMIRLSDSPPSLLIGPDGTFYAGVETVSTRPGSLFAFDKTGNIKWQFTGPIGAPWCYKDLEGNIYIDDVGAGHVRRMNPKTGTDVWTSNNDRLTNIWLPDSQFPEVGTSFLVYLQDDHNGSSQPYLGGFDIRTGKENWRIPIPDTDPWSW